MKAKFTHNERLLCSLHIVMKSIFSVNYHKTAISVFFLLLQNIDFHCTVSQYGFVYQKTVVIFIHGRGHRLTKHFGSEVTNEIGFRIFPVKC